MRRRILKLRRSTRRLLASGALFVVIIMLSQSREASQLESVMAQGSIKLITRPGPITYYEDAKGKTGFEYLLAKHFADYLGVKLEVTQTSSLAQLFNMLGGPNADFAGATLTITPERQQRFRFSDPYAKVVQVAIYRRGSKRPDSIEQLLGKTIAVVSDSSHEERLRELKETYPALKWQSVEGVEMIELIEMVNEGEIDIAIVDSTTYDAHRTIYSRTAPAFELSKPQGLAWVFPRRGDGSLVKAANRFLEEAQKNGKLKELNDLFFRDLEHFSIAGLQLFKARLETRLPKYRPLFRKVAGEQRMNWHLLAAVAYQESHWNPKAVSPTGVRGMMMLTERAASEVRVSDRTDPEQSIEGGAQYFLNIKNRLPEDIPDPDRTWFALAAYNVGMGHLEDARVLTERAGDNPHLWQDVRKHLPKLQKKRYYLTVRHGYARGQEPVTYVRNVRKYMRLLQWNTLEENRRNQREQRLQPLPPQEWNPDSFKTL
jgi:membrane-bound lytic murein transglycosylase F